MQVVNSFDTIPQNLAHPIAVTLGCYDGIHLGHQAIFKRLNELGKTSVVVTFSNHPSEVLNPANPVKMLYPVDQKLALIEECRIDIVVLLEFTHETASNTYDQFLLSLRSKLPYDYLILGANARLGKGLTGTPEAIIALGKQQGFTAEYLPQILQRDQPISSSRIRDCIARGDLETASSLLGRPYQ